jgi:hypothetical protein
VVQGDPPVLRPVWNVADFAALNLPYGRLRFATLVSGEATIQMLVLTQFNNRLQVSRKRDADVENLLLKDANVVVHVPHLMTERR